MANTQADTREEMLRALASLEATLSDTRRVISSSQKMISETQLIIAKLDDMLLEWHFW